MNEGMLITDDVAGGPPGVEVRVNGLGGQDGLESGFIGRVAAVAIFEFIHALEIKTDAAFGAVDLPAIVVLVAGRKPRGLEGSIGAFGDVFGELKFGEEGGGVIDGDFFGAFAGGSFEAKRLGLAGAFFDESFLEANSLGNIPDQKTSSIDEVRVE